MVIYHFCFNTSAMIRYTVLSAMSLGDKLVGIFVWMWANSNQKKYDEP